MRTNKRAFTLLELMIVVIIVGILASLALPRFIDAAKRARESEAMSVLGAIRSSQMRYYLENEAYTGNIGDLDLSLTSNPTQYYTYTAVDGAGDVVGQATAVAGSGVDNFEIEEDGTISTF